MGRMELPQAACLDLTEGLSNQKVQEFSRGWGLPAAAAEGGFEVAESSSSSRISPSSSSLSWLSLLLLLGALGFPVIWSSVILDFWVSSTTIFFPFF